MTELTSAQIMQNALLVNDGNNKTENITWNKNDALLLGQNTKLIGERCINKKWLNLNCLGYYHVRGGDQQCTVMKKN